MRRAGALLVGLVAALAASGAAAEDSGASDATLSGRILAGYRFVDVDGAERKYREDVNLDDGPRLLELGLHVARPDRTLVDALDLELTSLGGEPFASGRLSFGKRGRYRVRLERRESRYFYDDLIVPEDLANENVSTGGDFHRFNVLRVQDSARVDLVLSPRDRLHLGFERLRRTGFGTTTLDVERDEFVLVSPVDESDRTLTGSWVHAWERVTLVLEERVRDFDDSAKAVLPGPSDGMDEADAATLDAFRLAQPFDLSSRAHVVRVVAAPGPRVTVRASATYEATELDALVSEDATGTRYTGAPLSTALLGEGEARWTSRLLDVHATWQVTGSVALTGDLWRKTRDQDGSLVLDGVAGKGAWDLATTGVETGVRVVATKALTIAGGLRWEKRDVEGGTDDDVAPGDELTVELTETRDAGTYLTAAWRPSRAFGLTLRHDQGDVDAPFTLVSPTTRSRLRLEASGRFRGGVTLGGSWTRRRTSNGPSSWHSAVDEVSVHVARSGPRVQLGAAVVHSSVDHDMDQVVVTLPGFGGGQVLPFALRYDARSDALDTWARFQLGRGWTLRGALRLASVDGTFGMERVDGSLGADVELPRGWLARVTLRRLGHDEDGVDFDDYRASIAEVGVGLRW